MTYSFEPARGYPKPEPKTRDMQPRRTRTFGGRMTRSARASTACAPAPTREGPQHVSEARKFRVLGMCSNARFPVSNMYGSCSGICSKLQVNPASGVCSKPETRNIYPKPEPKSRSTKTPKRSTCGGRTTPRREGIQEYVTHKTTHPPETLPLAYA